MKLIRESNHQDISNYNINAGYLSETYRLCCDELLSSFFRESEKYGRPPEHIIKRLEIFKRFIKYDLSHFINNIFDLETFADSLEDNFRIPLTIHKKIIIATLGHIRFNKPNSVKDQYIIIIERNEIGHNAYSRFNHESTRDKCASKRILDFGQSMIIYKTKEAFDNLPIIIERDMKRSLDEIGIGDLL